MIQVNNQYITADEKDILIELRKQLDLKGIKRFAKIIVSGDNIQTNCPFHHEGQERKPSFGILIKQKGKADAGTCHCFACGWAGSFAEMVSNVFGYDDLGVYGAKWLVRNFLTVQVENRPDILEDFNRADSDKNKSYVTEAELDKYRQYHPYMWKRKMTPQVVDLFDIGYDKNTDCITFPVRDINGNCVFVARRSVKTKFFNYPQNAEKPVYGLYEYNRVVSQIAKNTLGLQPHNSWGDEVIICESMIDAITCFVYGKPAVALNGIENDLQVKQLRQMPNRKFILATDMDSAGQKARQRLKKQLSNKLVSEYIWDVDMAKDINDMTKEQFLALKEYML